MPRLAHDESRSTGAMSLTLAICSVDAPRLTVMSGREDDGDTLTELARNRRDSTLEHLSAGSPARSALADAGSPEDERHGGGSTHSLKRLR